MSNLLQASVSIKGIRPLMWHAFGPDSIPLEKKERTGVAGNDPERGRGSIQKYVQATLEVADDRVLIDRFMPGANGSYDVMQVEPPDTDPDLPVYLDIRACKNPSTKARNVRYRITASPGWQCGFTLQWDGTVVSRGEMEAIMIDAGRLCGLGDGRNIGMGRFQTESFNVSELE